MAKIAKSKKTLLKKTLTQNMMKEQATGRHTERNENVRQFDIGLTLCVYAKCSAGKVGAETTTTTTTPQQQHHKQTQCGVKHIRDNATDVANFT